MSGYILKNINNVCFITFIYTYSVSFIGSCCFCERLKMTPLHQNRRSQSKSPVNSKRIMVFLYVPTDRISQQEIDNIVLCKPASHVENLNRAFQTRPSSILAFRVKTSTAWVSQEQRKHLKGRQLSNFL